MSTPKRIQRRRTKGWRLPETAVCVDRTTRWGNRFRLATPKELHRERWGEPDTVVVIEVDRHNYPTGNRWAGFANDAAAVVFAVDLHRRSLLASLAREPYLRGSAFESLRGRDLACWCPLDQPCHADVLLQLANGEDP